MSEGVIRAFSQFLGSLNYGATHEEMTKQMNTLIAEMSTTRCDQGGGVVKGELTLKLTFKLDDIMEVTPEIKVKNPKNVEGKAVFFITADNQLSKTDPRQMQLDIGGGARMSRAERESLNSVEG